MNFRRVQCIFVQKGVIKKLSQLILVLKLSNIMVNSVDPDQMPHLICSLRMSFLKDARMTGLGQFA